MFFHFLFMTAFCLSRYLFNVQKETSNLVVNEVMSGGFQIVGTFFKPIILVHILVSKQEIVKLLPFYLKNFRISDYSIFM